MSRPLVRPRTLLSMLSLAAACGAAIAVPVADAAPLTSSAPGKAYGAPPFGAESTARQIRTASTSVDTTTGRWVTTVTFTSPRTAANDGALLLGTSIPGGGAGTDFVNVETDPARPTVVHDAAPVQVTYDASDTVLTVATTNPGIIGHRGGFSVDAKLESVDQEHEYSLALMPLGAVAPKPSLAGSGRHLVTSRTGLITVPIVPLEERVAQRVTITLGSFIAGVKYLPAKYYRRTSVTMRIGPAHLRTTARAARLTRSTWLDDGSKASAVRSITIRRRGH